jgi:hypothetical protein
MCESLESADEAEPQKYGVPSAAADWTAGRRSQWRPERSCLPLVNGTRVTASFGSRGIEEAIA